MGGYILLFIVAILLVLYISNNDGKQKQPLPPQQLQCSRCGNYNIQVTMTQYAQQGMSQTQKHKRSLADRTAYNTSRGVMNVATLGLWGAATPKRGKYKEVTYTQSRTINQKVAICQYCGFSWNIK